MGKCPTVGKEYCDVHVWTQVRLLSGQTQKMDGVECFGYMDYKLGNRSGDFSNQWSPCIMQDFRDYIENCGGFCRKS